MKPIYLAALISFAAGTFGYILYAFGLRPFWRYHKTKHMIAAALENDHKALPKQMLRRAAADLTRSYHEEMPSWLKLMLMRNNEEPLTAAKHLLTLCNTKRAKHAAIRIAEIRKCLVLTSSKPS
jgi:hypothetical protein